MYRDKCGELEYWCSGVKGWFASIIFHFTKNLFLQFKDNQEKLQELKAVKYSCHICNFFFLSIRVDFFIPGVPTVGGFTICSSHRLLKEKRSIDLAVKHSEHPPALWVHTQVCTEIWTLSWRRMPLLIRQTITVRPYRSD